MWCLEKDFVNALYQKRYKMCTKFPTQFLFKPRLFENLWHFFSAKDRTPTSSLGGGGGELPYGMDGDARRLA